MERLHDADLQLQEALSTLAIRAKSVPEVGCLQHVDLLTQTHCDLARLLAVLASSMNSNSVERDALKASLSLKSLQDTLFDGDERQEDDPQEAGDMVLF